MSEEPTNPPEHLTPQDELIQARRERDEAQASARRLRIAYERGLPFALAERLAGATEAELADDAARLASLLKPATPGVPPAPATIAPLRATLLSLSPEEVRKHKHELMR